MTLFHMMCLLVLWFMGMLVALVLIASESKELWARIYESIIFGIPFIAFVVVLIIVLFGAFGLLEVH